MARILTDQSVKDAALAKWSRGKAAGERTLIEMAEWWSREGSHVCSFCETFDGPHSCDGVCPLRIGESSTCHPAWEEINYAQWGSDLHFMSVFREQAKVMYDAIKAVPVETTP